MSDVPLQPGVLPTAIESPSTSPSLTSKEGVHASVQAHLEKEHTTRCGPQEEAHYDHWDPNNHVEHKKYDEIYHKMADQDPHDAERYEHIMHSPHVSTEAKLNAIDAMELPHTDQRCDLTIPVRMGSQLPHYDVECEAYEKKTGKDPCGLREPDHPEHREKTPFCTASNPSKLPGKHQDNAIYRFLNLQREAFFAVKSSPPHPSPPRRSLLDKIYDSVGSAFGKIEIAKGESEVGKAKVIEVERMGEKYKWVWVED